MLDNLAKVPPAFDSFPGWLAPAIVGAIGALSGAGIWWVSRKTR